MPTKSTSAKSTPAKQAKRKPCPKSTRKPSRKPQANGDLATIKKYPNRRLYDTENSRYITLDDLRDMICNDKQFHVVDAKSGADITHAVLTQIIMEKECHGDESEMLLPVSFLRQLITLYDKNMQAIVPSYLEQSMATLAANQQQLQRALGNAIESAVESAVENVENTVGTALGNVQSLDGAFDGAFDESKNPFAALAKRNMEIFSQTTSAFLAPMSTMSTMSGFGNGNAEGAEGAENSEGADTSRNQDDLHQQIATLQEEISTLRQALAETKKTR